MLASGAAFARGRDFSAWIGLVPRPETEPSSDASPSGATVTCACSSCKQPESFSYGRQAGRSTASGSGSLAPLSASIPNVLAAALANKLARIAWTLLAQERSYETRLTKAAA
jgi:transposase